MSSQTHNLPELFYVYGVESLYNTYSDYDHDDEPDWQKLYTFFKDQGIRVLEGDDEYDHVDWEFCFYNHTDRNLFLITFGKWFTITPPTDEKLLPDRFYRG